MLPLSVELPRPHHHLSSLEILHNNPQETLPQHHLAVEGVVEEETLVVTQGEIQAVAEEHKDKAAAEPQEEFRVVAAEEVQAAEHRHHHQHLWLNKTNR